MKKITFFTYALTLAFLSLVGATGVLNAQTDVTSSYLLNAGFDNSCNYLAADAATNHGITDDGTMVQAVTDWSPNFTGWSSGSSFEYGFAGTLNSPGPIPATDPDGASGTGEGTLGVCASWGGNSFYTQSVTLPAGSYKITYKVYNSGPATAGASMVGFVPTTGTSSLSSLSGITQDVWTADEIELILYEETTGNIQVGIQSPGGGSGSNGRFFFDDLKILAVADPILNVSETAFVFSASNLVKTFSVSGSNLTSDITLTAPAGVSLDKTTITAAEANSGEVTVTATASVEAGIDGSISISTPDIDDQSISCKSGVALGVYYKIVQNSSSLNIGASSATQPAVMTPDATDANQAFTFIPATENTETFSILSGAGTYLAKLNSNTWSTTYLGNLDGNNTTWELHGVDYFNSELRLKVISREYIASDVTTSGSSLYADKASNNANGAFTLAEVQAVIINYVDAEGAELKMERVQTSGLVTGETYTAATEDKADISANGKIYEYDPSSTDNVVIADGNANIYLTFLETAVSTDATLSGLSLNIGNLAPAFDPATTRYFAVLPASTTSVDITATTTDDGASVSGDGTVDVSSGQVDRTIIVTAEDGTTTKEYLIRFAVSNNLIELWDGNGDTDPATSYPDLYGWAGASSYNNANSGSGVRYYDGRGFDGGTYNNRVLHVRWDGSGGTSVSTIFSYPVYLEAGVDYRFKCKYGWQSNGSAGMYTFGINSANDNSGESLASSDFAFTETEVTYEALLYFNPSASGVYYLTVACDNAIMGAIGDLQLIKASFATGLEEKEVSDIEIYPTVSSDNFNVRFADKPGVITVFNITGKIVKQVEATSPETTISLPEQGIYLIKGETEKGSKVVRVIKTK